jgi:hypothetical protein
MPLNLNSDKLIVVVKPEQNPVIYTGYTKTTLIGSGATTVNNISGATWIVSSALSGLSTTLIGSGVTVVTNTSGTTWNVYTPAVAGPSGATGASGLTPTLIFLGSGSTIVTTNKTGTTYQISIYAPSGATGASGLTVVGPQGPSGLTVIGPSGATPTLTFTGSGSTVVNTNKIGNAYTIHIYSPSGKTGASGHTVVGPSGATPTLTFLGSGGTQVYQSQTGTTYEIFVLAQSGATGPQGISGNTVVGPQGPSGLTVVGPSGLTPTVLFIGSGGTQVYQSQTGTTYEIFVLAQSGATGPIGPSGLTVVGPQGPSGLTVVNYYTFHQSGATVIQSVGAGTNPITIYTPIHVHDTWAQITSKPSWLSGTTIGAFESAHVHSQYLTGVTLVTWTNLTLKPSWLSGTTLSAFQLAHTHSQYSVTGHTHVIANVTGLQDALDAKSGTGHTHAWSVITTKPSWLSGTTLSAFQLAHTHSQYLTGQTAPSWSSVTSKPAWLSGTTLSAFELQHSHATLYPTKAQITIYTGTTAVNTYKNLHQSRRTVNANYTVLESDNDLVLIWNDANTYTITLPSSGITIGSHYLFFKASGAGAVSFVAGAGSTIYGNCPNINSGDDIELYYQATGAWYCIRKNKPAWDKIQTLPAWLSGTTLGAFEAQHAHSTLYFPKANTITGATSMGGTSILHGTPVSANKIQLKGLSGGTNVTINSGTLVDTIQIPYLSGVTSAVQTQLNAKVPTIAVIATKTGTTYTALSTDIGKIIEFTATGATTITLPTGLATGYQITIVNYGNGTVGGVRTFAAGSGASIKSKSGNLKLSTVFDAATAYYRGSNVWVVFGDLTAT